MGQCYGKTIRTSDNDPNFDAGNTTTITTTIASPGNCPQTPAASGDGGLNGFKNTPARSSNPSPWPSPYPHGISASPLPVGVSPSPARASTPGRFFKRRFAPPSPAKHIKASLAKRLGPKKPKEGPIPEDRGLEPEQLLDKTFGYSKNLGAKYELGVEVGRGHFGHTCSAKGKKGELKDLPVAVKIISKAKWNGNLGQIHGRRRERALFDVYFNIAKLILGQIHGQRRERALFDVYFNIAKLILLNNRK